MIRAISQLLSFLGGPSCYNLNPGGHSSSHDCPGDLGGLALSPTRIKIHPRTPLLTISPTSCPMCEKARHRRETIRNLSRVATSDCPRVRLVPGRMLSWHQWLFLSYVRRCRFVSLSLSLSLRDFLLKLSQRYSRIKNNFQKWGEIYIGSAPFKRLNGWKNVWMYTCIRYLLKSYKKNSLIFQMSLKVPDKEKILWYNFLNVLLYAFSNVFLSI